MKQKKQRKKDCFGVEQDGDVIDAVDRFRDELANGVETYLWGPESDDEDNNNNEEEGRDGAGAKTNGGSSGRYGSHDGSFSAQPKQQQQQRVDRDRTSRELVDGSKRTRREMGTGKRTVGSKARYWKDRLEEQIDYTMGFQNDGGMCSNGSTSRCYTCRIDAIPQYRGPG